MLSISDLNSQLIKHKIVVIKYSANFCEPCQKIKPQYEELKEARLDTKFIEIDYNDMDKELLNDEIFGIKKIPCIKTFIEATKIGDFIGLDCVKNTKKVLDFEDRMKEHFIKPRRAETEH
jgi:thiol-disulfide isomerase/thioredoxin